MPTPKRERQKALQAAKRAKIQAAQRRRRHRIQGGGAAVVVVVAGAIAYGVVSGGGKPAKAVATGTTTTVAPTSTTVAPVAAPCPPVGGATTRIASFSKPPPNCLVAGKAYSAKVVTDAGTFTIALDHSDPTVVNNFVYLARYKFYQGLAFHRVIPGFVVQGGDPNPFVATDPQGPGYTVRGTVPAKSTAPAKGFYPVGTVAMAKTSTQPDGTAGSQYFVVVGAQGVTLPPQYAVLGHLTSGLSVVDRIEAVGSSTGKPSLYHYMISVTISTS